MNRKDTYKPPEIVVRVLDENNKKIDRTVRVGLPVPTSRFTKGKLTIVGDSGVGKSLFTAGVQERYDQSYTTIHEVPLQGETIAVNFQTITCEIDKNTCHRVLLWDTAGQERFRSLMPMYVRDSAGIIIMFDVTDRKSFENATGFWLDFVYKNVPTETPTLLVGNKIDMAQHRSVTKQEAEEFAVTHKLLYAETTALINASLHGALATIMANMFYYQKRKGNLQDSTTMRSMDTNKKGRCCSGNKQ